MIVNQTETEISVAMKVVSGGQTLNANVVFRRELIKIVVDLMTDVKMHLVLIIMTIGAIIENHHHEVTDSCMRDDQKLSVNLLNVT